MCMYVAILLNKGTHVHLLVLMILRYTRLKYLQVGDEGTGSEMIGDLHTLRQQPSQACNTSLPLPTEPTPPLPTEPMPPAATEPMLPSEPSRVSADFNQ